MMTKPSFGRKGQPDEPPQPDPPRRDPPARESIDYTKVAYVFIAFGLLGLLTSFVLSFSAESVFHSDVTRQEAPARPGDTVAGKSGTLAGDDDAVEPGEQYPTLSYAIVGPIGVTSDSQVLQVGVDASLPVNSWNFVEGELLDADKDYLFSFGKELWHEDGTDDGGYWNEADRSYQMKITIPVKGTYYLNIKTEGDKTPDDIYVTIDRAVGSSIPHMIFGILTLAIGLVANEILNGTLTSVVRRFL
jgi:hypothetical protein